MDSNSPFFSNFTWFQTFELEWGGISLDMIWPQLLLQTWQLGDFGRQPTWKYAFLMTWGDIYLSNCGWACITAMYYCILLPVLMYSSQSGTTKWQLIAWFVPISLKKNLVWKIQARTLHGTGVDMRIAWLSSSSCQSFALPVWERPKLHQKMVWVSTPGREWTSEYTNLWFIYTLCLLELEPEL